MTLSLHCYIILLCYLHHNNSEPPDYTTVELRMAVSSTVGYLGLITQDLGARGKISIFGSISVSDIKIFGC